MALVGLAVAACRGPVLPAPRVVRDPAAVALHQQGLELLWRGDADAALTRFQGAIQQDPGLVEAHRQRQILESMRFQRRALLWEYRSWLAEDPADLDRAYLLGRLSTDPSRQEQAFRAALRRDPEHPWLRFGLGQLALMRGRAEEAEQHFRRGLRRDPDHRGLRLGLGRSLILQAQQERAEGYVADLEQRYPGDPEVAVLRARVERLRDGTEAALHWMGRALARDPWMDAVAEQAFGLLRENGNQAEARWLARVLRGVVGQEARPSQALLALAFQAAVQAGDWAWAADLGGRLETRSVSMSRDWRRALFHAGRWPEALAVSARVFRALERMGQDTAAYREACRLLARGSDGPAARQDFARALQAMGWSDEAGIVLEGLPSSELEQDLLRQLAFEAELEALARDAYRAFRQRGEAEDLDAFLEQVREASLRILGVDLVADASRVEIPVVGSLLDPDPETGGAMARYFAQRGRLVVVGRRVGHPPEVFLAPRIAAGTVGGSNAYLAWVEGEHIPFFLQSLGARLSGAALVRFVYLDADSIVAQTDVWREWVEGEARALAEPLPARTGRERTRLDEPADVVLALMRRAWGDYLRRHPEGDWDGFLGEALEEVLVHEATHLQDEERLLEVGLHWLPLLPQFLRRGFQPDQLQAWAELRAQVGALRGARNPYLALANAAGFLPRSPYTDDGPHARAYEELLQRFVGVLDQDPGGFPGLDFRANLLQQLDRLGPAEVRRVAERLARDLGMGPAVREP